MISLKETKEIFRLTAFKHRVQWGSIRFVTGSELMVKYGLGDLGRARITLNRNYIDNEQNVTALAEDVMERLAARLSPSHRREFDDITDEEIAAIRSLYAHMDEEDEYTQVGWD